MKNDLDRLMQENGIDILLVTGAGDHNPYLVYLTGGAHLTSADLIKKQGAPSVLFFNSMERDEAASTGLETCSYSKYPFSALAEKAGDNLQLLYALRYQQMFTDLGITGGRVCLYGKAELGYGYGVFYELQKLMPALEFVPLKPGDILSTAMMTKSEDEIERIRKMGKTVTRILGMTAEYLTSQKAKDGVLVDRNGDPVTVGMVKDRINLWLAERRAENPEGTIFSIGRDAGVPHSSGRPNDILRLGQSLVFDFFPCEMGGGYFYDCTRTWCLGYAPDDVQKLYDDVLSVFRQIMSELETGKPFKDYQKRTCELFEMKGHPTVLSKPETEEGYVHTLGHGVGLHLHEKPFSGVRASEDDFLVPGAVFTVEPGLYYPDRGMGIRLEDTLYVTSQGKFEILAPYPLDLVLPIR